MSTRVAASDVATWRNPRIFTILALIFLSGAVAGALTMRLGIQQPLNKRIGPYWQEGGKEISLHKFKTELDLTESQAEQIETILDDFVMYYQTLQAQMDEVRANGKSRILHILEPEQKNKFEKMLTELQSRAIR